MYRAVILMCAISFAPSLASAQQPCTTDARHVVNELYRHMLERQADPASAEWVQQLESGRMTVREVVRAIATSPEHRDRFIHTEAGEGTPYERSVARLYRHILGRQPDAAGQRAFAQIAQRNGPRAVIERIIASREYDEEFGDWGVPGSGGVTFCPPSNANSRVGTSGQREGVSNVPVAQRRFRGMDRNNDGVISRAEWRGNARSFELHDWNNDEVISGDEINARIARDGRDLDADEFDRSVQFDDLDHNNNGRIDPIEWHGSAAAFNRVDVNNDNRISAAEFGFRGDVQTAPTSGQSIIVDARERWIDTGMFVRQGDLVTFDVNGNVRLSNNQNDLATSAGSRTGRRAANAPLPDQAAGALIGRIDNGDVFGIGNQRSIRAPGTGRLFLGVNDDHLADNAGHFEVNVEVQ